MLKNLSEHVRTLRGLTATRLRLDSLGLTPGEVNAMREDIRRLNDEIRFMQKKIGSLSADIRTLHLQLDKNAGQMDIEISDNGDKADD